MINDFNYKWRKIFAAKRYDTKDGIIKLTPIEQQELLDDSEGMTNNDDSGMFISVDYLMGLHPELNRQEAKSLKDFANKKTIKLRDCYNDGSIIYPQWKEYYKSSPFI